MADNAVISGESAVSNSAFAELGEVIPLGSGRDNMKNCVKRKGKLFRRIPIVGSLVMLVGFQFVFSILQGCGGTIPGPPPLVSGSKPENGRTNVPPNQSIFVTFSEKMNPSSVNDTSFTVRKGNVPVPGAVQLNGAVATFTPDVLLEVNTVYTVTVTTGATDLAGNAMSSARTWTFTTGTAPDTIPPSVTSTNPGNGTPGVALDTAIIAAFSEAVNPATITGATFTVNGVVGTVGLSGTIATFRPNNDLAPETTYTASITTGVTDLSGNPISLPHTWSFTTGETVDVDPPVVTSTAPAAGAGGVSVNGIMRVTFSEPIDPATITANTFTVNNGVIGTISLAGSTAIFTPNSNLAFSTTYTVTISSNVRDLAGNAMGVPHTWSFTTGAASDTTPPTVLSTSPVNGETGVALGTALTATFSEGMNPTTITSATFTINPGVGGTVSFSGTTATLTPNAALSPSSIYTATITTGATDLAGNPMSGPQAWSFTTQAALDTVPPTVVSTNPANGEPGVAVNRSITVTFSEPMDPATITAATFTLSNGVTGTVTLTGATASFTPSADLAGSTPYTATITGGGTGVKDLAGNTLVVNHVWTFTTGTFPDIIPPTVVSTNPANGEPGVAVNRSITVTFSEPMDPATITAATFTLSNGVTGTVTLTGATASFTPGADLAVSTVYTATIAGTVTDLSGNPLGTPHIWTFTTGGDTIPPTVATFLPVDDAVGVAVTTPVTATFSEPIDPATMDTSTFFVIPKGGAVIVAGAVRLDTAGTTATFIPDLPLSLNTEYRVTISKTVTDLAGNQLGGGLEDFNWKFNTIP